MIATLSRLALALTVGVALYAEDWVVPADAAAVANPVPSTADSISNGKSLYEKNCLICHGAAGLGDGAGATYLNPKPASFIAPASTKQTDGAIFYKISKGRGLMLGWATVLTDDKQRWDLVNFVRSIAPATK